MNVEVDLKFVKSKGFHQYVKEGAELIAESVVRRRIERSVRHFNAALPRKMISVVETITVEGCVCVCVCH